MVMATDQRIMTSGRSEQVEEDVNFAHGRRAIWLSTKSPLRDADGAVVGLVGTSLDITERKAIEASHREIGDCQEFRVWAGG
ncbi:PAS domain-containing protein [Novosphingobium resinovorum]|uniref:PAS domain-containing protein n=2 Tax=Novosphingobium TaxID=165696 RepID=UPI0025A2ADCB|nr:PAS domain-containing protein [Novosphingobium resinovorum]MBF7014156.1 PAS domain-containing protein [Novosphingobium sp. HR1a]WJM25367.1 PAS domain-containing protein [Novosphingobium resinovorum]